MSYLFVVLSDKIAIFCQSLQLSLECNKLLLPCTVMTEQGTGTLDTSNKKFVSTWTFNVVISPE